MLLLYITLQFPAMTPPPPSLKTEVSLFHIPGVKFSFLGSCPERTLAITTVTPQAHLLAILEYVEILFSLTSLMFSMLQYVAWISQLNTTYTDLVDINGQSGKTYQPGGTVFGNNTVPIVNGTMCVVQDVFVYKY